MPLWIIVVIVIGVIGSYLGYAYFAKQWPFA
jgi:hypothetical protein